MLLEARAPSCFSSRYLLKLDGNPIGQFKGRWYSEGIDIRLTERLQLHFEKASWLSSEFRLIDTNTEEVLAEGRRAGFFTRTWDLDLKTGPTKLVAPSLFSSSFEARRNGETIARASRIGWCERGCHVECDDTLDATDLIFVGLIYHTILQRMRRNNNSS